MTTESPEPLLPPPDFDETDKTINAPANTPPEPPQPAVPDTVGEAAADVKASAEIPEPAPADVAAGAESAEEGDVTFDLLMRLDKKNLKTLLGKVEASVAATALAGLEPEALEKILGVLTKGVAAALREEIGKLGAVDDDAKAEAQDSIVEKAEELEEQGKLSLDSLYDGELADDTTPQDQPAPHKTVERARSAEERTEAIAEYLKGIESGSTLIQRIIDMPNDATLKTRIGFKKLGQISTEVYGKVVDFFREFEEKRNTRAVTASELDTFGKTFIATLSKGDLAGFQPALRSVVYQDVKKKLFPSEEKAGTQAQAPRGPLTAEQIIGAAKAEEARKRAEKAGGVATSGTAGASPETASARSTSEWIAETQRKLNPRTAPVARVETPLASSSSTDITSAAHEATERTAELQRILNSQGGEQAKSKPESSTASAAEQTPLATFEDLIKADQDTLEKVLAVGTPRAWGRAMSVFSERPEERPELFDFVKKVRAFFTGDTARANEFDAGLMFVESDNSLKVLRNFLLSQARSALGQNSTPENIPRSSLGMEEGGTVKIPLIITRDMEQQLADKGVGKEARGKLTPEAAWKIIHEKGEYLP